MNSQPQLLVLLFLFFFNDTATTEIYTLSLHDALPISASPGSGGMAVNPPKTTPRQRRSEEHTSELQSRLHLVCRLLLEKKNTYMTVLGSRRQPRGAAEPHDRAQRR